jgi:GNAT superfamily N-acetyltransferase
MMNQYRTFLATPDDRPFITALQNAQRNELGFLGDTAMNEAIAGHRVLITRLAHQSKLAPALGFCVISAPGNYHRTIVQAAVVPDARRNAVGRSIVAAIDQYAGHHGSQRLALACASDLTGSLAFWDAMGFKHVKAIPSGVVRAASLIIMARPVTQPVQPPLLDLPIGTGEGRPSASRSSLRRRRIESGGVDETGSLF